MIAWKKNYFVQCVRLHTRFQSNVIEHLAKVEKFIINFKKINTTNITDYYCSDFDETKLELHPDNMLDAIKYKGFNISSVSDAIDFLKELYLQDSAAEVLKLVKIIWTIPVSLCRAEYYFSALWYLKTFQRSIMAQTQLNGIVIVHDHKKKTNKHWQYCS